MLESLSRHLCDLAALMVPSYERYSVRVPHLQKVELSICQALGSACNMNKVPL